MFVWSAPGRWYAVRPAPAASDTCGERPPRQGTARVGAAAGDLAGDGRVGAGVGDDLDLGHRQFPQASCRYRSAEFGDPTSSPMIANLPEYPEERLKYASAGIFPAPVPACLRM